MRLAVTAVFLVALGAFGGCQSSSMDEGCIDDSDCAPGSQCDYSSGECRTPPDGGNDSCRAPSDCAPSYTCGEKGTCMPGDCYFNGCVTGFDCQSSTGTWECLPSSGGAAGASNEDGDSQAGSGGVAGAAGSAD
ncbi:MAG TPA: hypothetical protein VFK05_23050 [Polyangiaceae bacterium]|nr:hypothetical protein [Polyangiaceae bacterium]